jgi:hypothetical protein
MSNAEQTLFSFLPLIVVLVTFYLFFRAKKRSNTKKQILQDAEAASVATLFTPRNATNTFSRAELIRDQACDKLVSLARGAGVEFVEQRSQAHSPNVWFRVDYLPSPPSNDLTLPVSVAVDIQRFDFHRFEHLANVTVQIGERVRKITHLIGMDESTVVEIHQHLITPGKKLRLTNRSRQFPWQFWRPRNTVKRLRRDWKTLALILLALGLAILPFGVIGTLVVFGWLYVKFRQRRTYVLTSGKPITDPRALYWLDSWQSNIKGLGAIASTVREGLVERLRAGAPEGATVAIERIGYWGTDRWVERDQIVVVHRRAIGFVHVVPYGDALYVGWESHLNSASWIEETLARGIDRISGLYVVANRVVAGAHRLNEYDLGDCNFLAEWMHEAVKGEVKLRMAALRIDQEIDFTVQRESRKDALSEPTEGRGEKKPGTSRFKRLA